MDADTRTGCRQLWSTIFALAFNIAGLVLTLQEKVRGDQQVFKVAFSIAIGISGAEIFLYILPTVLVVQKCSNADKRDYCINCGANCVGSLISLTYMVGCSVAFGFLVWADFTSKGIEQNEVYGCVNGFGCANIMGIIASIGYGSRVFAIAICLVTCTGIGACLACCIASGEGSSQRALKSDRQQATAAENANL